MTLIEWLVTVDWTPRPPHPDEPACWSWLVPPLRDQETEVARILAERPNLPRFGAGSPAELRMACKDMAVYRFNEFHAGRCAICDKSVGSWPWRWTLTWQHVRDHCLATGQVRGLVCRGCNFSEGRSNAPVLTRYRLVHPALILDFYAPYDGSGWVDGWPPDMSVREALRHGPRPATPWKPPLAIQ